MEYLINYEFRPRMSESWRKLNKLFVIVSEKVLHGMVLTKLVFEVMQVLEHVLKLVLNVLLKPIPYIL